MIKKDIWVNAAPKILKGELLKRELKYYDLTKKLIAMGIHETENSVRNKLSRGSFNVIFFLQVLRAIGVKNLVLDDAIFEDIET